MVELLVEDLAYRVGGEVEEVVHVGWGASLLACSKEEDLEVVKITDQRRSFACEERLRLAQDLHQLVGLVPVAALCRCRRCRCRLPTMRSDWGGALHQAGVVSEQ